MPLVVTIEEVVSDLVHTRVFERSPVSVGRQSGADLQIFRPSVSASHGEIAFVGGHITYVDLGSVGRSAVDGRQLPPGQRVHVRDGGTITIGDGIRLTVRQEQNVRPLSGSDPFAEPKSPPVSKRLAEPPTEVATWERAKGGLTGELARKAALIAPPPMATSELPPVPHERQMILDPIPRPSPQAPKVGPPPSAHQASPPPPTLSSGRFRFKELRRGERILNKYVVEGLVGAGADSALYKVTDGGSGRPLAAQIFTDALIEVPSVAARFGDEVRRISGLVHANLCRVVDSGIQHGHPVVLSDYLLGESLAEKLREGSIAHTDVVDNILGAAAGLFAAHQQGLFHGSLRTSSVFLAAAPNGMVRPKLLDLAAGRHLASLESAKADENTVPWLSPEQWAENKSPDALSDQHLLGQVAYEALTGKRPYRTASFLSAGRCDAPRRFRPTVPPELESVIIRALRVNPSDRFPSVHGFAAALLHFASEQGKARYPEFGRGPTAVLSPAFNQPERPTGPSGKTTLLPAPHVESVPATVKTTPSRRKPWPVVVTAALSLGVVAAGAWFALIPGKPQATKPSPIQSPSQFTVRETEPSAAVPREAPTTPSPPTEASLPSPEVVPAPPGTSIAAPTASSRKTRKRARRQKASLGDNSDPETKTRRVNR